MSHLFEEHQVVLTPGWRENRILIPRDLDRVALFRLGDIDLFSSKLMRDDALDLADARFIAEQAGFDRVSIEQAIRQARVPVVPEIEEHSGCAPCGFSRSMTRRSRNFPWLRLAFGSQMAQRFLIETKRAGCFQPARSDVQKRDLVAALGAEAIEA